tara:strand:- start:37 stop:624 length:588 start_codon:yes stop_codon:yes gene_type:complete
MGLMKKLSTYLFLVLFSFSVPSFADDISDFQIEGMSIGDNVSKFFTEIQIIQNTVKYHTNNKFITLEFDNLDSLKTYEGLQLTYKSENKIISEITGLIYYEYNIEDCYEKMDAITNDIINSVNIIDKTDKIVNKLRQDSLGKSEMTAVQLYFDSGYCQIGCYDWSDEKGWADHLRVTIRTNEFNKWSEENLITKN